jgi:hypothetical protein
MRSFHFRSRRIGPQPKGDGVLLGVRPALGPGLKLELGTPPLRRKSTGLGRHLGRGGVRSAQMMPGR